MVLSAVMREGITDGRCGFHDEARHGAVEAGAPALAGNHLPGLEFLRVLAEVPDIALAILRVVAEVFLRLFAGEGHVVLDNDAGHAGDLYGPVGDRNNPVRELAVLLPAVGEGRPRRQRVPGI